MLFDRSNCRVDKILFYFSGDEYRGIKFILAQISISIRERVKEQISVFRLIHFFLNNIIFNIIIKANKMLVRVDSIPSIKSLNINNVREGESLREEKIYNFFFLFSSSSVCFKYNIKS